MPLVALALLAGSGAQAQAGGGQAQQTDRGEQIMNATCTDCHDLRTIQTQARNKAAWAETLDDMVAIGAKFKNDEERAILTEYLASNFGPLPDGPGKRIVLNTCTMCHDLKRFRFDRRGHEEWEETLNSMLNEGGPQFDEEFPVVLDYLSKNFNH